MDRFRFSAVIVVAIAASFPSSVGRVAKEKRNSSVFLPVDDDRLRVITRQSDMVTFMGPGLDPLLRERVAGTAGNAAVRRHIVKFLKRLSAPWKVKLDSFDADTPLGNRHFSNVVATLDPHATRRLVLACHFDSKYFASGEFIGATDSAVPCAMLLDIARIFDSSFTRSRSTDSVTLQLLFFDGEEAFVRWSSTDSIYGARHLASKMESQPHPDPARKHLSALDAIEAFVLLDLIGTSGPLFWDYFSSTSHLYRELQEIEQRLKLLGLLHGYWHSYFPGKHYYRIRIEDDHIPFLQRGVPVLHLIPHPFPPVWHKLSDKKAALDPGTIDNLNRIFRVFVVEYLHLHIDEPAIQTAVPVVSSEPGSFPWMSGKMTETTPNSTATVEQKTTFRHGMNGGGTEMHMSIITSADNPVGVSHDPGAKANFHRLGRFEADLNGSKIVRDRKRRLTPLLALNDSHLSVLSELSDMTVFMGPILNPLLCVRVAGTPENVAVRKYIVNFLKQLSAPWHVELDSFNADTPLGNKHFSNIVATLDSHATRRLVLACHFDSKYFVSGKFIGATDSAVPCAMLLDIARIFDSSFTRSRSTDSVTLQLLFFDGEEAFVRWSSTDSIYGARHLASKMESQPHPDPARKHSSALDAIEAFVLLDLIGTSGPLFWDYFSSTSHLYRELQEIEQQLKSLGLLHSHRDTYFPGAPGYPLRIGDDHIPFLQRGVPVLHLIPHPFPPVWHKLSDKKAALDPDTIDNLNQIFRVFVVKYLHLHIDEADGQTTIPAISTVQQGRLGEHQGGKAGSVHSSAPLLLVVTPLILAALAVLVRRS